MCTEAKELHSENAAPPMEVMLLGMVIEVNLSQRKNAATPMDTTLLGIVTEIMLLQP